MITYNNYGYNKDEIKNSLSIDQVFQLISELGGEPIQKNDIIISRTICHNHAGSGSYKLYYYNNSHLLKCFTDCEESYFDVFELVKKQKTIADGVEWSLTRAINFVASYFGFNPKEGFNDKQSKKLEDWEILKRYEKLEDIEINKRVELKIYDGSVLNNLPKVRFPAWEKEGILKDVMDKREIRYDPINEGIIIPHYNIDGELIGIRERTLIKENEKLFGKYRPAILNGIMYNHPLGFSLYNLNNSKDNILTAKKVIILESEKATMQYQSFFGEENDISVAVCGSSLTSYQMKLLLSLGVQEVIIAFDKQFQQIGDEEHKRWVKKLIEINRKYSPYVQVSFMFDKEDLLGYKESPTDRDKEVFLKLFERRIIL